MTASTELDEAELVAAVLRKDRKASAAFVDRYADPVYSYVRYRLLPRTDLVDDVVQDVFLSAWEGMEGFRGESSLRGWLLGIARHRVEDHYRLRAREIWTTEAEPPDTAARSTELELGDRLDQERVGRETRRILAEMPEPYSIALLWRYWEKRSARDMAQATGRTEKSVERILARARADFRKRWNDECSV